jgi:predicted amidohydrolase YtcJ
MLSILFLIAGLAWAQTADIIVENANIYTVDTALPRATAVAVRGDRIAAVGQDLSAYAAFEERSKGSLTPGKLADFVMLSRDIMQVPPREILSTRVLMTVLGGEVVYQSR